MPVVNFLPENVGCKIKHPKFSIFLADVSQFFNFTAYFGIISVFSPKY